MNIKKTMDLAAFFSTPTPPPAVLDPAGDVPGDAPVQPITKDKVSKPIKAKARPTKSKRVKEKEPKEPGVAARTTKTSKKSPAKPTSAKKAHSGNLADVDDDALDPDADADPDADMDRDFDEIPEDDSQWGGGEDIHENESEIGDDHACMDDEDLDDDEIEQYGSEEEEEEIPAYEGQKKKDSKKEKKKKGDSNFASYEEFAHLLDGDSDEEQKSKNLNAMMSGAKRTFS